MALTLRTLPRLHAKILVIDDRYAILGSQNFTRAGRKNKEGSAIPGVTLAGSPFISALTAWALQAEAVDEELVDLLLAQIAPKIRQQRAFLLEVAADIDQIVNEHVKAKQMRRLRELEEQSRYCSRHAKRMPRSNRLYGWRMIRQPVC